MYSNHDSRLHDAGSYRQRRVDLVGPPQMMIPPPVPVGAPPSYGRGGPHVPPPPYMVNGGRSGYPMEHGVGRGFGAGHSSGFVDRGRGGGGGGFGGRGHSYNGVGDRSREGGRGGHFSGRGFDHGRGGGGFGGGRGGRGSRSRGDDLDNISLPKQDFSGLIPFKKDFYVESPSVRAMTEQEVVMYRARREITVEGHDVPKPIRVFEEASFPGYCLEVIARLGFVEPTPIQSQVWPMALRV